MKQSETEYLEALFSSNSDLSEGAEIDIPLVEVPENLGNRLCAIADSAPNSVATVKRDFFQNWPRVTSVAAGLFLAIMGYQFYQQQQTFKQLEKAQADLATALHYLGEANRITQAQVLNSLNDNMNKAGVEPAMDIGRSALFPDVKQHQSDDKRDTSIKTSNRSL